MKNVSKSIFLNSVVCPTVGWLMRMEQLHAIATEATLGDKFRIEQGNDIHKRARDVYPNGLLIDEANLMSAAKRTLALMDDPNIVTIFEGTFIIDGFVAKADILKREGESWHLLEVKSSVNDKKEFIDDMAYTTMVISRCGFDISKVSLVLVSRDFRLGMDNIELFCKVEHTDEVLERVEDFRPLWGIIEKVTRSEDKPDTKIRFECRKCGIFNECFNGDIENHVFDIPRLNQKKFDALKEKGIFSIEDIPSDFPLTDNQTRVRECVINNISYVGNGLKNELSSISWPAYYLDFETVMTAIPLYNNIAPYTQIPSQYSIHKCSGPGQVIEHFEYLADQERDCRKELAKKLISDLKGEGSIIAYSSFEKTQINGLAKLFPDLSNELNSLIDRIVDLEAIIRRQYYHSDFHGSTSIKRTLPVLVPEMTYDGLEINEGDSAMASFAYLALGKFNFKETEAVKRDLLEYCKQDTLAMVKLHQKLVGHT